jgi:hypothetical protein
VLVAAAFAHVLAFAVVLQRYAVGNLGSLRAFYLSPDWQPPGGVLLSVGFFTVVVAVSAVVVRQWLTNDQSSAPNAPMLVAPPNARRVRTHR